MSWWIRWVGRWIRWRRLVDTVVTMDKRVDRVGWKMGLDKSNGEKYFIM